MWWLWEGQPVASHYSRADPLCGVPALCRAGGAPVPPPNLINSSLGVNSAHTIFNKRLLWEICGLPPGLPTTKHESASIT